ncbi:MAG: hypothetical protein P8182_14405 [Deltaproteobacteria bacterium]
MSKRKIRARDIVADIQAGMDDTSLMEKYVLTSNMLEKILRQLVEADLITHFQLYERTRLSDSQVTRAFLESGSGTDKAD